MRGKPSIILTHSLSEALAGAHRDRVRRSRVLEKRWCHCSIAIRTVPAFWPPHDDDDDDDDDDDEDDDEVEAPFGRPAPSTRPASKSSM